MVLSGRDDRGQPVCRTARTDLYGRYSFGNLRPGDYYVREVQPKGFADGKDSVGSLGGRVNRNDEFFIQLGEALSGLRYNFGDRLSPYSCYYFSYYLGR